MRILLTSVIHFKDVPGGMPRIVLDESLHLARQGHEVFVLAGSTGGLPEHELSDGVHLLRYVPERVRPLSLSRMKTHQIAATRVLRRHLPEVDAIHGHAPLSHIAALDLYGDATRSAYTVHSPVKMEMEISWHRSAMSRIVGLYMLNSIERDVLRRTQVVTALSKFTIECLRKLHGTELARRVQLVPGWTDTARYLPVEDRDALKKKLNWPEQVTVFFTLRRMEKRMGLGALIAAADLLRRQGFRFHVVIAGDGHLRETLRAQVRDLRLEDTVTFSGRISDDELPICYAACDAFILPTQSLECFGLIAVEALAAGRPVLATPVGAIPEVIAPINQQWLSRSASPEDIADRMMRFLRGELSIPSPAELHAYVEENFSATRMVERLTDAAIFRSKATAG